MSDELTGFDLNLVIAKAVGYRMEIYSPMPGFKPDGWYLFYPVTNNSHWCAIESTSESVAWGYCFQDEWIPRWDEDLASALDLWTNEPSLIKLFNDDGGWYLDAYTEQNSEPIYIHHGLRIDDLAEHICRAWLKLKQGR